MKKSKFTESQIIGILKVSKTEVIGPGKTDDTGPVKTEHAGPKLHREYLLTEANGPFWSPQGLVNGGRWAIFQFSRSKSGGQWAKSGLSALYYGGHWATFHDCNSLVQKIQVHGGSKNQYHGSTYNHLTETKRLEQP